MRLTKGERLYLQRRRRSISQAKMAKRLAMSHDTLAKIEKGKSNHSEWLVSGCDSVIYASRLLRPTKGEQITILRRRLGMTLVELAKELGMSRVTLMARERGKGDPDYVLAVLTDVMEVE